MVEEQRLLTDHNLSALSHRTMAWDMDHFLFLLSRGGARSNARPGLSPPRPVERIDSFVQQIAFFLTHGPRGRDDDIDGAFGDVGDTRRRGQSEVKDSRVDREWLDAAEGLVWLFSSSIRKVERGQWAYRMAEAGSALTSVLTCTALRTGGRGYESGRPPRMGSAVVVLRSGKE